MSRRNSSKPRARDEGWQGWDDYARFYDWENQRTIGRRDIRLWQDFVAGTPGRVLELGCGTGRVCVPLARAGAHVVGVDRSAAMLARARARRRRAHADQMLQLVRADIRSLPFDANCFQIVIAPYGIIQSLLSDRDLRAVLQAAARALEPGGRLGIDIVAELPGWREYRNQVQLRGRLGPNTQVTLIESVVQEPRRRLTGFTQRFITRTGRQSAEHRFNLQFRTPSLQQLSKQLEQAGFRVDSLLGGYAGNPWREGSEAMIIVARRV